MTACIAVAREKTEGRGRARGGGLTDYRSSHLPIRSEPRTFPYPVTLIPLRNRSKDHFPPGAGSSYVLQL